MVRLIKSRRLRWARHIGRKKEGRQGFFNNIIGKPTGKRLVERLRRTMDLKEICVNMRN